MNATQKEQWNDIILAHDRRVFVSLLAMGLSPERARELAQMTWTRLIEQQAAGALPTMTFPGLAIRQAKFLALSELRKNQSDARVLSAVPTPQERAASPDANLESKERLQHTLEALEQCSPNARRLFKLIYTPPFYSHKECAQELGLSLQRTRQILCETRSTLRKVLETTR